MWFTEQIKVPNWFMLLAILCGGWLCVTSLVTLAK
jgi:hypothetical protein